MTALLVTIDELRALRRIMDIWLPGFVVEEDDEDLRVDAAALRGLAARGLMSLPAGADIPADLAMAERLTRHLAPYRRPRLVAELEVEDMVGTIRYGLAAAAGVVGFCTELAGGLASVELADAPAGVAAARLCRLDRVAAVPGYDEVCHVDWDAHVEADELASAGDVGGAVAALVAGGAPAPAARAWAGALGTRLGAAAVRVAHAAGTVPGALLDKGSGALVDTGTGALVDTGIGAPGGAGAGAPGGTGAGALVAVGELRWLVGQDGTAWHVTVDEPATAPGGWDVDGTPPVSVIAPIGGRELGEAMDDLFAPVPVGGDVSRRAS